MKKWIIIGLLVSAFTAVGAQTPTGDDLLRMTEQLLFPAIYHSTMTITTEKPGQQKSVMRMETWYKEGSGSFIEMTAPARSRGIRFLEKESSLYLFNPKSNSSRPLRLSPEQSFQGTVFSNNDLSDPRYTDNYTASIDGEKPLETADSGTVACLVVNAVAKNKTAPYGRIVVWIAKETMRPLRFDYYAKSGLLFKSMTLRDYKWIAGALRPCVMHMDSFEVKDSWSEVVIDSMEKLDDIPDSRFTTTALIR